jgi:RNA-directed DNA polymerase
MAEMPDRPGEASGGTAYGPEGERQARSAQSGAAGDEARMLMEEVLRCANLSAAHARVVANGGAPGVDGMTVEALAAHCRGHWPRIREELLSGRYQPQPVRRVEIPKPGGGVRMLGIPTVLDRMIQQALLQVLTPIFDPTFSADSYGFRPGRSAHQAVERAREHIAAGHRWVVDLDLAKFFDTVNHDVLMHRVALRVRDKRVLQLIGRYLRAGTLEGGLVSPRTEGTPQGGPLSPLLSNILLDDLDKELERRGHRFVRYADDGNVYVQSQRAGERVMASLERFLTKQLRLKVNRDKSAVARPWNRGFLGYSVTVDRKPKLKVAPASIARLKQKLRAKLRSGRGQSLAHTIVEISPLLRGWIAYYRLAETKGSLELLDQWIRRKLRVILWRQWKRGRTRYAKLRGLGIDSERARLGAGNGRGPWWNAGASHMNEAAPTGWLRNLGLVSLLDEQRRLAHST